ncbi:hypothetical protein [Telmatospirillum sp.]|uniref:hypothetical protein n=1 Tax=Telmatospirillum sp. TaxID=2079197 RepID=UPI0028458156|nr:hypothetical protein [Telmatospirillum sp.]MDR3437933.1 hypothetical protein [Telmatospirillum sp.]
MNDSPDFVSVAERLVEEAQSLGAIFLPDGTWTMAAGQAALPVALADRLRAHRAAIAALQAAGATE